MKVAQGVQDDKPPEPSTSLSLPGGDPDDVTEVEHGVAPVARHKDHLAANAPRRIDIENGYLLTIYYYTYA